MQVEAVPWKSSATNSSLCKFYLSTIMMYCFCFCFCFFKPVNKSSTQMELKIKYSPISLGKLRIWASVHHSFTSMRQLGKKCFVTGSKLNKFLMWIVQNCKVYMIILIPSVVCLNRPVFNY